MKMEIFDYLFVKVETLDEAVQEIEKLEKRCEKLQGDLQGTVPYIFSHCLGCRDSQITVLYGALPPYLFKIVVPVHISLYGSVIYWLSGSRAKFQDCGSADPDSYLLTYLLTSTQYSCGVAEPF